MASTNVSDYRFSIFINNDQAKKSLVEMEKVMIGYQGELKKLEVEGKKNTEEYKLRQQAISKLTAEMHEMRKEAGLQALSLKELKSLQAQLRNEMARAIPGSERYKQVSQELGAISDRIKTLNTGAKQTGMTFGQLADGFNRYFAIVTAGIAAISGLAFSIKEMITAQGELDDSLANIRKSTGMTAEEVKKLNAELGKIDTRTSRQDLRQMAVVAGQIGVAKDDVLSFVESVDKLNVALGDEFTGGAEEVAKQMGMMRNVLTDIKSSNIADDMLRIGNAVNTLGAAGFATGPVMADFASRIGGVGIALGLSSDQVLGMSATLQELNVNAERGGTAVVKILQKMTTNTDTFAKVAGVPVREFTQMVNTDLYGAFLKVIEGSNRGGQSATALAGIIKELEVSGVGASEIFAKFGNNTAMLTEKIRMAGTALQGTDSVLNEFNIKNATLGAVMDKLKKDFYNLITLPGVTEFFKNQVYHVVNLVNWIKDLPLIFEKYRLTIIALTGAFGVWIAAKTRSIQLTIWNNLTMKEGILLKMKDAIVMQGLIIQEEMLTIWKGKGTVATKLATTAQWLWNAAIKANPIGLLITAVTALVGVVAAYEKYNTKAVNLERQKAEATILLTSANAKLDDSYQKLQKQMGSMNTMSEQEKKNLRETLDLKIKNAEADLMSLEAKQKSIGDQSAKPTFWQGVALNMPWSSGTYSQGYDYYADKNRKEAMSPFEENLGKMRETISGLKALKTEYDNIAMSESTADKILTKTHDALTEKLNKYQVALRNTTAGSDAYHRIQAKITATNKELAKFNDDQSSDKGPAKKVLSQYEKLNEELKKYEELLRKQVKDDPKQAAVSEGIIIRLKEQIRQWDDLINKMNTANTPVDKMKPKGFEGLYKSKPPKKLFGIFNEAPEEELTPEQQAQQAIENADQIVNSLARTDQVLSTMENAQLERDARVNEQKKLNFKRQLDAKLITQKQYDESVAKLDADLDRKRRKLQHDQAVRQKAFTLAQAMMNVAEAVTKMLTAGPLIGQIMAGFAAAMGAIQIGMILNTPVPQAMRGRYNVVGREDGRSYSAPYIKDPPSGVYSTPTLFAETGREIILNPRHTENLMRFRPDLISAIMSVPQRAAGSYAAAGGSSAMMVRFDDETLEQLRLFREALRRPVTASISYDNMVQSMDIVSMIQSDVSR